ncbi:MAG: UDP-2,3-diacylglucosamine diphosphatase [Crocinitomicaceae bacterium]|nr:UDP-2,3-diacylglucosamine diphosphatase [Flavobacteriales bacterium]NQZ35270.1 UDP-2,3-diacylglucosamine diphosphatase [Crocinitomicaceae bacterium]PHR29547.1 MAG: UDP-2,3-diacylglucosamine hydrolase [Fluviicola sp.]
MTDSSDKRIYFASDFHLGAPSYEASLVREKRIVAWLDHIKDSAQEIYLVGDIFDFWFEYKRAIPKGFVRLQGKIAELTDQGIPIHVFTGNHDMWIFDYLPQELGIQLYREPIQREFFGKKYFIGHGDGLGPGDRGYKFIKKVFANRFCQWCFARLHPNFGIWLASKSSQSSRAQTGSDDEKYLGDSNEWLVLFCQEMLEKEHIDNFIFGHRHLPLEIKLNESSTYYNLGEWINYNTYLEVSQDGVELKTWEPT